MTLRWVAILLTLTLLAACLDACGNTDSSSTATTTQLAVAANKPADSHYLNDGDHDTGDEDPDNSRDADHDAYLDYLPDEGNRYHDRDDSGPESGSLAGARAASAAQERAIGAAVERYYAAVSAGRSANACLQLSGGVAKTAPLDYGSFGPSYLRGAKTCAVVLSRFLRHYRAQLARPAHVTGVGRLGNHQAIAYVGSTTMPASFIRVTEEGGVWRVSEPLGAALR